MDANNTDANSNVCASLPNEETDQILVNFETLERDALKLIAAVDVYLHRGDSVRSPQT